MLSWKHRLCHGKSTAYSGSQPGAAGSSREHGLKGMRRLLITYLALMLFLLLGGRDSLKLTPVEEVSARYHFDLAGWELANFPAKWLRELGDLAFPFGSRDSDPLQVLQEYFLLEQETRQLRNQISRATATGSSARADGELERRLQDATRRRDSLRTSAEQALEAVISTALREEGIPLRAGEMLFPPVDFALERPPLALAVSPRGRIELAQLVLLDSDIPIQEREALEERILREVDLSALVVSIGGIATYPSILNPGSLRNALIIASHEWLHHYLFFRPLGQSYFRTAELTTLNETTANIFGDELGNRLLTHLTGVEPPTPQDGDGQSGPTEECREPQFCFSQEMRRTRLRVDQLLAQGEIVEAEAYMEQRRQLFVENGYLFRKLNQAYFARNQTYADNPASVSPIYDQLTELRGLSGSLAEFIHLVSGISSYNEFIAHLERLRIERSQPASSG